MTYILSVEIRDLLFLHTSRIQCLLTSACGKNYFNFHSYQITFAVTSTKIFHFHVLRESITFLKQYFFKRWSCLPCFESKTKHWYYLLFSKIKNIPIVFVQKIQ